MRACACLHVTLSGPRQRLTRLGFMHCSHTHGHTHTQTYTPHHCAHTHTGYPPPRSSSLEAMVLLLRYVIAQAHAHTHAQHTHPSTDTPQDTCHTMRKAAHGRLMLVWAHTERIEGLKDHISSLVSSHVALLSTKPFGSFLILTSTHIYFIYTLYT